jgi:hypothetical protein
VAGPVASFTGDGAYDQKGVYARIAERHSAAAIVVPPRATGVPSRTAESEPTQRDGHLHLIAERGRMAWQKASGYNRRARAETAISRFKRVIGPGCARARMSVGRPRWAWLSMSSIACWSWDARPTSALPDSDMVGINAPAPRSVQHSRFSTLLESPPSQPLNPFSGRALKDSFL